jgi:hypothetical protein
LALFGKTPKKKHGLEDDYSSESLADINMQSDKTEKPSLQRAVGKIKHALVPENGIAIVDAARVRREDGYMQEVATGIHEAKGGKATVLRMNDAQRLECELTYKEGQLVDHTGKIGDTTGKESKGYTNMLAFALDQTRPVARLFVAEHSRWTSTYKDTGMVLSHASFTAGKPVEMSGMMSVNAEGKITSINTSSGHYIPDELDIYRGIKQLQKQWPDAFAKDEAGKITTRIEIVGSDSDRWGSQSEKFTLDKFIAHMEKPQESGKPLHQEMREERLAELARADKIIAKAVDTSKAVGPWSEALIEEAHSAKRKPALPPTSQSLIGALAENMGHTPKEIGKIMQSVPADSQWPAAAQAVKPVAQSLRMAANLRHEDPEMAKFAAAKALANMIDISHPPKEIVAPLLSAKHEGKTPVDLLLSHRSSKGDLVPDTLKAAAILIEHGAVPSTGSLAGLKAVQLNALYEESPATGTVRQELGHSTAQAQLKAALQDKESGQLTDKAVGAVRSLVAFGGISLTKEVLQEAKLDTAQLQQLKEALPADAKHSKESIKALDKAIVKSVASGAEGKKIGKALDEAGAKEADPALTTRALPRRRSSAAAGSDVRGP